MNFEKLKLIVKNPEHFLINNFPRYKKTKGFRLELFIANKYNLICPKLKWLKFTNLKCANPIHIISKSDVSSKDSLSTRRSKKTFCPFCEKAVIPKRIHKLDVADIVIILFTAGLWAVFLLVMYIFIRRCPVCNYNLRGFKHLPENEKIK